MKRKYLCKAEIREDQTVVIAARKAETIDSKDPELSALIERRKIWTEKDKAQVKDISNKIKQGIRDNKRSQKT